jgi:hypothetical protein
MPAFNVFEKGSRGKWIFWMQGNAPTKQAMEQQILDYGTKRAFRVVPVKPRSAKP